MNPRLKIAAETRKTAREIFASLPHEVRFATALKSFLKIAFGDEETSLGLAALYAMSDRGVTGNVFGADMEDIGNDIRRGGSKVYKKAKSFGTSIIEKGLAQYKNPELREKVLQNIQAKLYRGDHKLSGTYNAQQALKYLQKMVWMEASTLNRSGEFQVRKDPSSVTDHELHNFMANPRLWAKIPGRALDKARRDLTTNPIFLDGEGRPRVYQYIEAMAGGISERAFAQEIGMSAQAFRSWLGKPNRQKALQKALAPLLDYFEMV